MVNQLRKQHCNGCGREFPAPRRGGGGRPRRFCSSRCRRGSALRNRPKSPKTYTDTGQGEVRTKPRNFLNDINGEIAQNGDLQKSSLFWIEVNAVTWKLTDGGISRTPASHGQWPGFNTERALAWVIDTGWVGGKSLWYARCGDRRVGPATLREAKAVAEALFAQGVGGGSGTINLNGVAAASLERPAKPVAVAAPEAEEATP